jgi:hypothetical protein
MNDYSELLDLIIASPRIASKMNNFKVEHNELLVSDHLPVKVWFSASDILSRESQIPNKTWDFKKANWSSYRAYLESKLIELIELVNQPQDIEKLNKFFTASILEAASK